MDPKLYKTLKQLVKLGIINNNTRIRQVRRKRRKRKSTSSSSVLGGYAQPTDYLKSNVVYSSPSSTIQSEQALINLKASEFQLERALTNRNLPDEHREKIIDALEKINKLEKDHEDTRNFALEQRDKTTNAYNYQYNNIDNLRRDFENYKNENQSIPNYTVEEPDIQKYNSFVPQTKNIPNPQMNPVMGLLGDIPKISPTVNDWVFYRDKPKSDEEKPPIDINDIPVKSNAKTKSSSYKSLQMWADEYKERTGNDVNKSWTINKIMYEINRIKIKELQDNYRAAGGTDKIYLADDYNDYKNLNNVVGKLIKESSKRRKKNSN